MDGTHISARVPVDKQIPYRGKKITPTQNIMCACSFDMRFTFVMIGWEGTTNDSRIFLETVTNPENEFPMPPRGKYYVVDSGYTNMPGFLTPYRGERYHLRDYRGGRNPQGPEEIFNYTHSSLRNVIERCFGVLKGRFPILRDMPSYDLKRQKYIALACCVIHNYIRMHDQRDPLFEEFGNENIVLQNDQAPNEASTSQERVPVDISSTQLRQMASRRDRIAEQLWTTYNQR